MRNKFFFFINVRVSKFRLPITVRATMITLSLTATTCSFLGAMTGRTELISASMLAGNVSYTLFITKSTANLKK